MRMRCSYNIRFLVTIGLMVVAIGLKVVAVEPKEKFRLRWPIIQVFVRLAVGLLHVD